MKVKNIKSFIDFYKSIGVTIEIGKKQRKIKREDHFKFLSSPKNNICYINIFSPI